MHLLRDGGLEVVTGSDVWGHDAFMHVPDVEWIGWAAENGCAGLTADEKIRYKRPERDALIEARLQVFCFPQNNLLIAEQARRVLDRADTMERWIRQRPGPWLAALYSDGVAVKTDWR